MRLKNEMRKEIEFGEGMHFSCDLSDPELRLTHLFLTSFICEEVYSNSIWTEIPKFATKYVNLC